jgi:hypothetical protein
MPDYARFLVDENARYPARVLGAVKAFARCKPWQGTTEERQGKFQALSAELATVLGLPAPVLVFIPFARMEGEGGQVEAAGSRQSWRRGNRITLVGSPSVVTFLCLFGTIVVGGNLRARRWGVNLFRRCFPRSWAGCEVNGAGLVVRRGE